MKIGKISNTILKRTVLKTISGLYNAYVPEKNKVGLDANKIYIGKQDFVLMATDCGIEPVYTVVNNICARGGRPVCIQCSIVLPQNFREIRLREIMEELSKDCYNLGLAIAGGHTQVSDVVLKPIISVTGIGIMEDDKHRMQSNKALVHEDIVLTKWIGIGGIRNIIEQNKEQILSRYNIDFIDQAMGNKEDMSVLLESEIAKKVGVHCMHDVSQGGIFAALWDMAQASGVGIDVDLRKIPVKQEIIEICEMYDINPYQLQSAGCLLMTFADGYGIVKTLAKQGIKASVIGRTISGNDKIIHNLDEVRYLDLPKQDSLYADWKGNVDDERKNIKFT